MDTLTPKRIKVLLYVRPSSLSMICLPILQPLLQTYYNDFGDNPDQVEWLVPYDFQTQAELEAYVAKEQPDVIGLSIYVWNTDQSLAIGKRLRTLAPNALILAGGPGVTLIKDDQPFIKYPFLDAMSNPLAYGEWFFLDLLNNLTNHGTPRYHTVQSAIYPTRGDRSISMTSPKHRDSRDFTFTKTSIYRLPWFKDYARRLLARYPDIEVRVLFESDRGCPYACSFCEWGVGDRNKLIRKDMDLILEEIKDLAEIEPSVINIINSNFGILNRDQEILELMGEHIATPMTNKPTVWFSGLSKTNKKNLFSIYEVIARYKFSNMVFKLSVQDYDEAVKDINDRVDVPIPEMFELAHRVKNELGIPFIVERIIGLPGKTLESAYNDYDQAAIYQDREGRPSNILVLLEGTPAAEPAFMAKHKVNRNFSVALAFNESDFLTPEQFNAKEYIADAVCATATYTEEDFATMLVLENLSFAFLNKGHLRYFFHYARRHIPEFTVSEFFRQFMKHLIDFGSPLTTGIKNTREFVTQRLLTEQRVDTMVPIMLPEGKRFTTMFSYFNYQIVTSKREFVDYVRYVLSKMSITVPILTLEFFLLRTLDSDYNPEQGRVLTFNGKRFITHATTYGNYNRTIHSHIDRNAIRWLGTNFKEDNLLRFTQEK